VILRWLFARHGRDLATSQQSVEILLGCCVAFFLLLVFLAARLRTNEPVNVRRVRVCWVAIGTGLPFSAAGLELTRLPHNRLPHAG